MGLRWGGVCGGGNRDFNFDDMKEKIEVGDVVLINGLSSNGAIDLAIVRNIAHSLMELNWFDCHKK